MPIRKRPTKRKSHTQSKQRITKKVIRSRKSARHKLVVPRTAKQYFSMSRKDQDAWDRTVQVPAKMRDGLSLPEAAKESGITRSQVLHRIPTALRKTRNGRYVAKASDRLLRILPIPSKGGLIEIALRDSRQASLIGEYWSAVDRYLSTGSASGLSKFKRIRIRDASGKRIRLLTDLDELRRQGSAGVLRFESLYGRTT
jgi:hypothetical protein